MKNENQLIQGFSKQSKEDKLKIVASLHENQSEAERIYKSFHHSDSNMQNLLDEFSENTITNFPSPFCACPNMLINGKNYMVPMVIEESSVIAAASKSAKIWFTRGGFKTEIIGTEKVGQVHFLWTDNTAILVERFEELKHRLLTDTTDITENMVKRGGGILDIQLKDLSDKEPGLMQLFCTFNTVESMGANFINSCLEQFAKTFKTWHEEQPEFTQEGLEIIMCILSNLTPNCRVKCWVECTYEELDNLVPGLSGKEFARRFRLGMRVAELDPYRATTHNKGIYNGIDAVVLATGNDFRAIEACGHAYASKDGKYTSLSRVELSETHFKFILEVPMALGVVGGLTNLHPLVKMSFELLGHPSAPELMGIAAAAGVANNFSAVKSLVTVGIQKGHMKMHLLNILKQLEVPTERHPEIVEYFKDKVVSMAEVRKLVEKL